jgi:hypothetical protein
VYVIKLVDNPIALKQLRDTLWKLRQNLDNIQLFVDKDDIDLDDMTYQAEELVDIAIACVEWKDRQHI